MLFYVLKFHSSVKIKQKFGCNLDVVAMAPRQALKASALDWKNRHVVHVSLFMTARSRF